MVCPNCKLENPEGMNFCGRCGRRLAISCAECQFRNPPDFEFCGNCGAALSGAGEQSGSASASSRFGVSRAPWMMERAGLAMQRAESMPSAEGERRHLTVMFVDLVDSTPLSQQLDPEDLRDVMRNYQAACVRIIARFQGHVAKYLGDGLLVYFGYPRAHEDDAQRAVLSALEIVAAMRTLNTDLPSSGHLSPQLQVRVGIHTGLAVVGEIGAGEYREQLGIVGETPNIAARLQQQAQPDTVILSAATYQLVQGFFECEALGPQSLKGVSAPIVTFRAVGPSDISNRFQMALRTGLLPLIGREREVASLRQQWELARRGEGQVALVSGEPGIGKSRLVQALKDEVIEATAARIEFHCSPYHQNSAMYPVIEHLKQRLDFSRQDSPGAKLAKLKRVLADSHLSQREALPLVAALLSLPHPEGYAAIELSPAKQKRQTQEVLIEWLIREVDNAAICCICEDLHWADPSTLELLDLLLDQIPTARVLLVFTFRPEFSSPWRLHSYFNQMTISRLDRKQVEAMVELVARGRTLPADVLRQVVSKTDGVPLFVEELTKMVMESGFVLDDGGRDELSAPPPAPGVPATLYESLMARLDRLGGGKEVAQLAAMLGREFSYELLEAVSPLDGERLRSEIGRLVAAEFLYQRGLPPRAEYMFKHALIRDTAYHSLLRSRRQEFHRRIAAVLEQQFAETKETQPELIARHYTEAGLAPQAIHYWQRAGQLAIQRSANTEAIGHLTQGLQLLKDLVHDSGRLQQELDLQITLGPALMAQKGYAAPEVENAYARARELCQQLGETPRLFTVLRGLWGFYAVRGNLPTAHELARQCLNAAQHTGDSAFLLWAHYANGMTLFHSGEFAAARQHIEQGAALYDLGRRRAHRALQDPGVSCLSFLALSLWCLGYTDQALERSRQAVALAGELSHPHSVAYALNLAAVLHHFRREPAKVLERVNEAVAVSNQQGFSYWLAWGILLRGWAVRNDAEGSVREIQQGFALMRTTGAELAGGYHCSLLAEAYGEAQRIQPGLDCVAEALRQGERNGEHFYDAELHRLRGELLLKRSAADEGEGEACFRQGLAVAKRQQARSLELRATASLARLLARQGQREQARQLLGEILDWFSEGLDSPDVKDARVELDRLNL